MPSFRKLVALSRLPHAWPPLARTRTAAAVEHLPMLRRVRPATLIDIGANKGQFSLAARLVRADMRIVAFEPLASEAAIFRRNFSGDPHVTLHPFAIGEVEGARVFHVADRADSSSLLNIGAGQNEAFNVRALRDVTIDVKRLDSVLDIADCPRPRLLKVDVQGAEAEVIRGSRECLGEIDYLYVEVSFVELYGGQALASEIVALAAAEGFELRGAYNLADTRRFGPTQADFLFERRT